VDKAQCLTNPVFTGDVGVILSNGLNQPIAPQAFAETAPLFFDGYFVGSQGLQLETRFATYAQLYASQPWIAAVVDKIAASTARLGVNVWDTSPATGNELKLDSPFAKLMAKPGATLDPFAFWMWLASTIEIYGEAYLLKVKDGEPGVRLSMIGDKNVELNTNSGKTVSFIPMHPAMTQTFRASSGEVAYWFMGQPNTLMAQDMVVPFLRYNPNMTQRGFSRMEPLRSTLMNEDSARRAVQAMFKNMGRPGGFISVKGKLDPVAKQRLREQWNQLYAGSENVGSTAVLENDSTFQAMQLNSEEMQYIESRKLNREEVCGAYDMPPPCLQILDRATFSNISEQMRSLYRDTMTPRLGFIESPFNHHVAPEFGDNEIMQFDMAKVTRGDFDTRATGWTKLVQSGIAKPSEARPHFDLGDAGPAADKLYAQQQLQPLGAPPPSGAAGALPPGQSDNGREVQSSGSGGGGSPARVHANDRAKKYMRDLGGRIGSGQSLEDAARAILKSHPEDEADIAEACIKVLERQAA
jgi:HK97 family phage portal protein